MRLIDRSAQLNRWRHVAAGEKLMLALCAMVLCLATAGWPEQLIVLTVMTGLTVLGAGVRAGDLLKAASVPAGFILAGSLAQALQLDFQGGPPWIALGERTQLMTAAFTALRSAACISALLFLALTTPLSSLIQIGQRAGMSPEVTDIAAAMLRFVWLTLECVENAERALAARLGYIDSRRMIRSNGMLLAALLPRVFSRAQRMENGLAARGYSGRLRLLSRERKARPARLGLMILLTAALMILSYGYR